MAGITNTALAQKINDLIQHWQDVQDEFQAWIAGEVDGGPNSDGEYPLTDYLGNTVLVKSPAQLEEDVSGTVGSAVTAQAAAEAAQLAAESARDDAETAETNAETAETGAVSAKDAAVAAQSAAESARTTSIAQASAASGSATAAAGSASDASDSADAASTSATAASGFSDDASGYADAAAASAAAAATFDPDNFYLRTALDGGQLDNRYYTETEIDGLIADADLITSGTLADARLSSNVSLLDASNVFTSTSPIRMVSVDSRLQWSESDAGTDEKNWTIRANNDSLLFQTASDAAPNTGVAEWMVVARTGTAIDEIELNAAALDFNGAVDISGAVDFHDTVDIFDATGADKVQFNHNGLDLYLTGQNTRLIRFNALTDGIMVGSSGESGSVYMREMASATSNYNAWGKIWVKSDAPNTLWFTDDSDEDQEVGHKGIPVVEVSGNVTIDATYNGKMVYRNASGSSVAFTMSSSTSQGFVVTVWNRNSNSVVVTRGGVDSFRLAGGDGSALTSVTIPQNGMATFHRYVGGEHVVQGSPGVS